VPEHAEPAPVLFELLHSLDGAVDAQNLMVLRHDLAEPPARILEQQEAFNEVEEAGRLARRLEHRLQRHALRAVLVQTLPRREELEGRVAWTQQGFEAIREDDETVEVEQARDGVAIVTKVVVVSVLHRLRQVLPLDQQQRDAIDEADGVGAALVEVAREPDL
jgi:hypothetical protein